MDYLEYKEILNDPATGENRIIAELHGGTIRATPVNPPSHELWIKILKLPVEPFALWAVVCDDCQQILRQFSTADDWAQTSEVYERHCDFHGVDAAPYDDGYPPRTIQ